MYREFGMVSGIQAALSALQAYSTKIQNNANNVANANTEGFKKGKVILTETLPQGVRANVEKVDTPGPIIFEETNTGLEPIEQSNVDLSQEFPEMINNQHAFEANLKTLQAENEMLDSLLDIKA